MYSNKTSNQKDIPFQNNEFNIEKLEEDIHKFDNHEDSELKKKKIIRYSLIIGIITAIIVSVIIIIVIKTKKKDDSEISENDSLNPPTTEPSWDNLIPKPSEEEMKELIKTAYNITTVMTQSEIQEILSNDLYQIIRFTKGTYNLEIESDNKIYGLKFSRKRYVILDKGVIFNITGEPFKNFTDYYAIIFVRVVATKEEPMNFIGTLEINGNRNPSIDADFTGTCGMGLSFYSSQYINFQEIYSYNNHGDGIYIGSGTGYTDSGEIQCNFCSNIKIGKARCKGNYRNGISVIAGINITINEIYVEESIGSLPEAGIDFEPNNICEIIDIKINKIFSSHNNKCGITTYPSESESVNVSINEAHSDHDSLSLINGNFGFFAGTKTCSKVQYFYHIKKVFFNIVDGRDKEKYIVTQNWGSDCHSLEIDNITFIE